MSSARPLTSKTAKSRGAGTEKARDRQPGASIRHAGDAPHGVADIISDQQGTRSIGRF